MDSNLHSTTFNSLQFIYSYYARIAFIITILILIFTKSSYAKGFLEVSSFLYGVLIGLNLILIVIPLVINLIDPVDGIGNEIYFSLFESLVKMILAFVVYKLSTEQIIVVRTKNN